VRGIGRYRALNPHVYPPQQLHLHAFATARVLRAAGAHNASGGAIQAVVHAVRCAQLAQVLRAVRTDSAFAGLATALHSFCRQYPTSKQLSIAPRHPSHNNSPPTGASSHATRPGSARRASQITNAYPSQQQQQYRRPQQQQQRQWPRNPAPQHHQQAAAPPALSRQQRVQQDGPNALPTGLSVTWLGTSSGNPTLFRNVSCTVVRMLNAMYLVDAGEGSVRQLLEAGMPLQQVERSDPGAGLVCAASAKMLAPPTAPRPNCLRTSSIVSMPVLKGQHVSGDVST
jgi:hypothetical protein